MEAWDVPHAGGAVTGSDGVMAQQGDIDRPFPLASVTKLLTAYASLVAIEEGTITLDEPAGPPGATVRHLLAHAAGFGFDTGPLMPPGRRRTYSNTGIDALGEHLAQRAGMSAIDYVVEAVVAPLGLHATVFTEPSLAFGLTSTVNDLSLFVAELLQPTLIGPATLTEATTVQFPGLDGVLPGFGTQSPNDWGLGFELRDHKSPHWTGLTNSPATFGHFGGTGTFLWVDPAINVGMVLLTDRAFGPWAAEAWPPLSDAVGAALQRSDR